VSTVLKLQLDEDQVARLERAARSLKRPPADAAVLLLEEALRERDFPWIEFRDAGEGRQAFLKGTRLAVWHVAVIARELAEDVRKIMEFFGIPEYQVTALLAYARAYADEIQAAIDDNDAAEAKLTELLPNIEIVPI
jgi:uncharacterized protein (DUF433 family)